LFQIKYPAFKKASAPTVFTVLGIVIVPSKLFPFSKASSPMVIQLGGKTRCVIFSQYQKALVGITVISSHRLKSADSKPAKSKHSFPKLTSDLGKTNCWIVEHLPNAR
jgi:hypothetical protein